MCQIYNLSLVIPFVCVCVCVWVLYSALGSTDTFQGRDSVVWYLHIMQVVRVMKVQAEALSTYLAYLQKRKGD